MKRNFSTPVFALILALSTFSVVTTASQATAQNAFVVGQTYQTSAGNYVSFVGNDRNGQPIFAPIAQPQTFSNFNFGVRSYGLTHRSRIRSHRNRSHRSRHRSHHRHHARHHGRHHGRHSGHRGHSKHH